MKKLEELNYYEVLNVEPSAAREQIEKAYLLALATFRPDWFATYSLLNEEEREKSLRRVEQAFAVLSDPARRKTYDSLLGQAPPGEAAAPASGVAESSVLPASDSAGGLLKRLGGYLRPKVRQQAEPVAKGQEPSHSNLSDGYMLSGGQYLRTIRLSRGLSLEAMADSTRINIGYLRALEEEQYDRLPSGSYLHYMLAAYAKSLKLDADWIVKDFKEKHS
ncbi:MAG: hypothetical protein EHM61_21885 [Acidobacteria bacterium]|nr:MAG: hypothetical protein EHM61_21885 [Acidobacteriota bacterium]